MPEEPRLDLDPAALDPDLPGPFTVGAWANGFRDFVRKRPRVLIVGEVFNLRRARASTYFELRDADGAAPCAIWNNDLDRLGLPEGAFKDGAAVVIGGGPDYYPGSQTASPGFSFRATYVRLAGEGDLLAQLDRSRRKLDADGLLVDPARAAPPGAAEDDRRGHRPHQRRLRRPARRARAPRLAGDDRLGRRPGPGPPRGAGDRRRPARAGRAAAGRGRGRLSGRRQPQRPVGVLRRGPLSHGGDAAAAGDRGDRPRGRPDADRRRRRGLLLDPDPRRRGAGRARRHRRPRRAARGDRARRPRRDRGGRPAGAAAGRVLGGAGADAWPPSAGACTRCCARSAPRRAGATASACSSPAPTRWWSSARATPSPPPAPRRCKRIEALGAALAAHDPERTLARGYALVADRDGEPVATAAAARERRDVVIRFVDDAVGARVEEEPGIGSDDGT